MCQIYSTLAQLYLMIMSETEEATINPIEPKFSFSFSCFVRGFALM